MRSSDGNSRRCIDEIFEKRNSLKQAARKNFNIAVPQTPKKIKNQKITVYEAYRSMAGEGSPQGWNSYNYTKQQTFQE
ncbi:UNVERIFIED_CONTAM: hypothetical protein Sangu_2056200 [Sesamum angustifolium]|uniref:Uncharacterized protein n=1 Tax=Sesamum angustifolium TaxID=2727405 RepID=A0AAW2LKR9_9LAMI